MARRDDRACREHVREEQRRQPGCPARELCREPLGRDTSATCVVSGFSRTGSGMVLSVFTFRYKVVRKWARVLIAPLAGATIFGVGFRLTDEVMVIVPLLGLTAAAFGFSAPRQWWLMAIGLGIGVSLNKLDPAPPYVPEARHLALYGPPRPLGLPFGLTGNPDAETIAPTLILMPFLFVATGVGSIVRWSSEVR